jgi:ribosomal protein S18 acetylase RimI-like enzyme
LPTRKSEEFTTRDKRTITLRSLASTDIDGLLRFANAIVREKKENRDLGIASFDKRLTKRFERKFLRATIESVKKKTGVNVAAFAGGKLVGECMVRGREPDDLRHTGLLGIVILKEYRGVGLGEKLMLEILREARRIGIWLVELEVMAINKRVIHLYERIGFRKVGIVPNKIQRDGRHLDIVTMYADLRETINPP